MNKITRFLSIKLVFTFLFISGILLSCKSTITNTVADNFKPLYTTAQLVAQLDSAYASDNPIPLVDKFFGDWQASVTAQSKEFMNQNDTIKTIYEIFRVFYSSSNLVQLGDSTWKHRLYDGSKYIAIQSSINYGFMPFTEYKKGEWVKMQDSLYNFRPQVDLEQSKVVYLTKEYFKALTYFLQKEINRDTEIKNRHNQSRYELIRSYIPIVPGHWGVFGKYWHIETHPQIRWMVFNLEFNEVLINFRLGYEGGETHLIKINGKWNIYKSELTWIE